MPIFSLCVNRESEGKLVPITRQNGDYIVPSRHGMTLNLAGLVPRMGPSGNSAVKMLVVSVWTESYFDTH